MASTAMLALCGCVLFPREHATAPPMPSTWVDAPVAAEAPLTDWWKQFNDPTLDQLIAEGLQNGPTVQIAALRVREARAQNQATIGQTLPSISAVASGNYSRNVDSAVHDEQMVGAYGPQVSWEAPLFGRFEAALVGARANTLSARADARGAQVALAADIAQAYVNLRAAQNTHAALEELYQSANQLADILDTSARAGIAAPADAANARRLAESTHARVADAVIAERGAENALAVLRGITPGAESEQVRAALAAQRETPTLLLSGAPAAPADFIRLRPDVARAEAQTLLAAAALADARASMLPQINLIGAITTTQNVIGTPLVGGTQTVATARPLITLPLFDWGALRAQSRQRNAQFQESLIQYRQTVTQAVAEASNALVSLDQGRMRLNSSRAAEQAATISDNGARAAYQAGLQSLTDRLTADQQLIDARLARISAEQAQASAAIATYRAFGGGPDFNASVH
ncbi:MAG: efflux transporter outer membrane subunit [Proteobacteria bacterium]|nr:efflux transporter outer membrane subunit [Pseudomonadota bacterium]